MSWRFATKIVTVVGFAVVVLYDVIACVSGGVRATISRVVLDWVQNTSWGPLIPLGVGVLAGHLFWHQPSQQKQKEN